MNLKMFKKVIKQTDIIIDFSNNIGVKPNTVKLIKKDNIYYAYRIDNVLNKTLIIETSNESNTYKAILKHFNIRLNKFGYVISNNVSKRG